MKTKNVVIMLGCALVLCVGVYFLSKPTLDSTILEVFEKEWNVMDNADKQKLEQCFKSEQMTDSTEYWKYIAEIVDLEDRINPWQTISSIALPQKAYVYIDNSSSMKGYYESKNPTPLIEVCSGITGFYSDITGSYIDKDSLRYYDWSQLTSDLTHHELASYSDAFQIDELIKLILANYKEKLTVEHSIHFIITDGIASGTNDEIRRDRDFNKSYSSMLQARLADAFSDTKGLGASIYQFASGFDGDYYFYNNIDKSRISGKTRPFYVIALGDATMVADLAEHEQKGMNFFKALNKVHFGTVDKKAFSMSCPSFDKNGDKCHVSENLFEDDLRNKLNIQVQFSLNALPYFARTNSYLEDHMMLKFDNDTLDFKPDVCFSDGNLLSVNLKLERDCEYKLSIKIMNSTPSWVSETSCEDDKKDFSSPGFYMHTFNFKYLVEGIKNGITHSKGEITLIEKEFVISTKDDENIE